MKKTQTRNFTYLLLILTGILLPTGLNYFGNITTRIIFIATNLFSHQAVLYSFSFSVLLELALIIGLIVLLLYPKKLNTINFYFELKTFKRLGILFIILYSTTIILSYFSQEQYETALQQYLDEEPIFFHSLGSQMVYLELYSELATVLKGIFLLALYSRSISYIDKNNS